MGIRCTGWEIICNTCGKSGGVFPTWSEAEDHLCKSGWAWYIVSAECPECADKANRAERKE